MCKELSVIVNLESVNEAQSIESSRKLWITIFFERILEVIDILADSVPSDSLYILDFVRVT